MDKRFVNKEFSALKRLTAFISDLLYAKEDLNERLDEIADGQKRIDEALDLTTQIVKDILATGPESQKKQLYNTIKDYKIELIPLLSSGSSNIIMSKTHVKNLIDIAKEKCSTCVENPQNAKRCALYKILEVTALPDSYETLLCPYSTATWAE
jgi:hypothetical protein